MFPVLPTYNVMGLELVMLTLVGSTVEAFAVTVALEVEVCVWPSAEAVTLSVELRSVGVCGEWVMVMLLPVPDVGER